MKMIENKNHIIFDMFQSKIDIKECMDFQLNHVAKLQKYSIKVSSTGLNWIFSNDVYGITVKDENNNLLGGIRVHVKTTNQTLPFEDALKCSSNTANNDTKAAEICALWTAKRLDNVNLPFCLVNCAVILCKELNINKLYTFPWQKTQPLVSQIGFQIDPELGTPEGIPYPSKKYRSFIMSANLANLKLPETKETNLFSNQLKMGRSNFFKVKANQKSMPSGIPVLRNNRDSIKL